jgi:glucokinase
MGYRLGIDIGATKTKLILLDPRGNMLAKEQILTQSIGSVAPIAARAGAELNKLLAKHHLKRSQLEGCGIGVAGQLDPETGVIDDSPNLQWFGVQFKRPMEKALGLKIRMANDVNAAAWGEYVYGSGRKCPNLAAVFAGSGIGGGFVMNGTLVEGASGTAAEVGHSIFREDGIRCDCHRIGCHEAYAGGHPMEKRMRRLAHQGKSPMVMKMVKGDLAKINTRTIADAAKKGDRVAGEIWKDATLSLCVLCAIIVSFLNPNRLVLGGGVIEGNPSLLPAIRKFVNHRAVALSASKCEIMISELKGDAIALGAAALMEI